MIAVYELSTGDVLRYVMCPRDDYDLNVEEGQSCIEVAAPLHTHARVVDGQLVDAPVVPVARTYGMERAAAYPNIGDQLDAIWKVLGQLDRAALPPEAVIVLDQVAAVKAQYPKP